jgi:hypothetical protein
MACVVETWVQKCLRMAVFQAETCSNEIKIIYVRLVLLVDGNRSSILKSELMDNAKW